MDQKTKIKSSYRAAVVSGVFCMVLSLLLLLYIWDLKEEVNSFDLLVQKGDFKNPWLIITGTCLLLIGGIFLAISMKIYVNHRTRITNPEKMINRCLAGKNNCSMLQNINTFLTKFFSRNSFHMYERPEIYLQIITVS